jgi:hypothetical protein
MTIIEILDGPKMSTLSLPFFSSRWRLATRCPPSILCASSRMPRSDELWGRHDRMPIGLTGVYAGRILKGERNPRISRRSRPRKSS